MDMNALNLRYRQVHLDFHTSAQCEAVGGDFDAESFGDTLKDAQVNSINLFAKCHHGYSYYPTRVGTMHPNLTFDLLGQQIEALHHRDILCPVYVSVLWDDLSGMQHPEWVIADKEGKLVMRTPLSGAWGWITMDISSQYADYVLAQAEELCDQYDVDGFWFDICFVRANYSPWAQAQMLKAGVNIADDQAVFHYYDAKMLDFFKRASTLVKTKKPQATIFYNGTVTPAMGKTQMYQTHFEVESLPTSGGAWGYLHFPIMGRQARTYRKEVIGMTGRFHKSWADFGGLKTQDQLDYECGTLVAAGARICVGDQLHPRGVLDPAVYRLLGKSFGRIEALEPWLIGAKPAAELAILALGSRGEAHPGVGEQNKDVEGAAQVLLETGRQFDIVDPDADFSTYPALILPDGADLDNPLIQKLEAFVAAGGKLVASGTTGLNRETGKFQFHCLPVIYQGLAPTLPSYLRLNSTLVGTSELATDYDYVFYDQAYLVKPKEGTICNGTLRQALFNRTWEHFTSHQHAPVGKSLDAPLAVQSKNVLYFSAPLFSAYRSHDYWAYRAIAQNVLDNFLAPPLLIPGGPGWVEFTLHHQPFSGPTAPGVSQRKIVHAVAYHPRRSLQSVQHVDQSWQTSGLSFQVRAEQAPERVYLAPEKRPLSFEMRGDYVNVALPPAGVHTVTVIE